MTQEATYELGNNLKQSVLATIDRRQTDIIATLQRLVCFPTVNPPGNEQAHQEYVMRELQALGFQVHSYAAEPGRPNILGVLPGKGGGRTLLYYAGHADVVDAGDPAAWQYPPFGGEVHGGWLYGRGAVDHKAPIAASLGAIQAIRECGAQLAGDLIVMVPVDEEQGSAVGTRYLLEQGVLHGDIGIYASAGFLEEILVACSGTLTFEITVRGRASHSGYPHVGINAIGKASKLVQALHNMTFDKVNPYWDPEHTDRLRPQRTGSLTVTAIHGGGVTFNVVPAECIIRGSRRLIPAETVDEAQAQIEDVLAALAAVDPDFQAEARFITGVRGINTPAEAPVVRVVEAAVRDLGLEPVVSGSNGGFDCRWIQDALGIPFVSYGAGWNGPDGKLCLHAPNECISIENLIGMSQAFALIILRACGVVAR